MEDNHLSEFLKLAQKKGKIKELEDAFKEYPVANEWHKGKIENVIREEKSQYNIYSIGDIVFVKQYEYQDGTEGNNYLFVIIEQNNLAVPIENFCMLISLQMNKLKYMSNQFLKKTEENGLNTDSIVKTDILYKITNNNILFKIGKVDSDKVEEYKNSYINLNKNNIF